MQNARYRNQGKAGVWRKIKFSLSLNENDSFSLFFFWLYSITISFSVENRWFILYVLEGKLFKYSDEILNTFLPSLQRDISQFEIGSRRRIFFINLFLMCLNFFSYFFSLILVTIWEFSGGEFAEKNLTQLH